MIDVVKASIKWGVYNEEKNMFYPNDAYKEALEKIMSNIKPNEYYHICIGKKVNSYIYVYDNVIPSYNINTIILVSNGNIVYINDEGQTIKEFYNWKLEKNI